MGWLSTTTKSSWNPFSTGSSGSSLGMSPQNYVYNWKPLLILEKSKIYCLGFQTAVALWHRWPSVLRTKNGSKAS